MYTILVSVFALVATATASAVVPAAAAAAKTNSSTAFKEEEEEDMTLRRFHCTSSWVRPIAMTVGAACYCSRLYYDCYFYSSKAFYHGCLYVPPLTLSLYDCGDSFEILLIRCGAY